MHTTGQFDEYHFAPPDQAAAFLAEKDPLAVYETGKRKGQRKSAASIMWDFERGELPQGVFAPAQNIDGDEIDHDAWIEAHRAYEISVYDLEQAKIPARRKLAPARLLTIDQWNAILSVAPADLKWRDVLISSARHGSGEVAAIAREVGRTPRRVRQIQDWHLTRASQNLAPGAAAAHLGDQITTEAVTRRPPAKSGRKRKGGAIKAEIKPEIKPEIKTEITAVIFDLFGDPVQPRKPRQPRKVGARQVRARPTNPYQMELALAA